MAARRAKLALFLGLCVGGTVLQFTSSCVDFGLQFGLATFDTCAILNCTDGTFFNFCDPVITLVDCPNADFGENP